MITVLTWRWGGLFEAAYVTRLRDALARHLAIPHELVCVTDDKRGLEGVRVVPMPSRFASSPRCRRRMQAFSRDFATDLGARRILAIDLDVVVVGDLTPLVDRPAAVVGYRVGHAGVYSGSFLAFNAGALDGAWKAYQADPIGYPARVQPRGVPSDQAMINHWIRQSGTQVDTLTEADGLVTYYGKGYESLEHWGIGPRRPELPAGARIVILGSADKAVMDTGAFAWVRDHWGPPLRPQTMGLEL